MGRGVNKLSVKAIERDLPAGLYGDGGGLYLQVSEQERADGERRRTKAWVFRFMIAGRARKMGLGDFERVKLADARKKAYAASLLVVDGIDPIEHRNEVRATAAIERAPTFRLCAERYVKAQEAHWRNAKHRQQWANTLETYAYPVIGGVPVDQVTTAHVLSILQPIWEAKNETASRLRGRIREVLQWAYAHDYRKTTDNPAAWPGKLKDALPKVSRTKRIKHHPAMPYKKLPVFMRELSKRDGISARALEFTILTVARTGSVIQAEWSEIDFKDRVWICPADHMKGEKEHRVPLSAAAIKLLKKLPRDGKHIFPGAKQGKGLSDMAMLEQLRELRGDEFTVHGFRSSFKDWATEQTDYPNEMTEIAMAHAVSDKVEAAYRRGDMFEKRRRLMSDWSAFCQLKGRANG